MATAAQSRIDDEIDRLLSSVYNLWTRRNTFSPVARLPTETLANIFVLCASDYYHKSWGLGHVGVPSWLNVLYVCRLWRNVTLTYQLSVPIFSWYRSAGQMHYWQDQDGRH